MADLLTVCVTYDHGGNHQRALAALKNIKRWTTSAYALYYLKTVTKEHNLA
jgi:hypothetical protein